MKLNLPVQIREKRQQYKDQEYPRYIFSEEHIQMEEVDGLFILLFRPGLVIFFVLIFIRVTALGFAYWDTNWIYFYAGIGYLLVHHRKHHPWEIKNKLNFDMGIPLWDSLLKTKC